MKYDKKIFAVFPGIIQNVFAQNCVSEKTAKNKRERRYEKCRYWQG